MPNRLKHGRVALVAVIAALPCAVAQASPVVGPPGITDRSEDAFAGATVVLNPVAVDRGHAAIVDVSCPAGTAGRCSTAVKLSWTLAGRAPHRLARLSLALSPDQAVGSRVVLPRRAAAYLRHGRTLRLRAAVLSHDSFGLARRSTVSVALRAR